MGRLRMVAAVSMSEAVDKFGMGVDVELVVKFLAVAADGVDRDSELTGDVFSGFALDEKVEDLPQSWAHAVGWSVDVRDIEVQP